MRSKSVPVLCLALLATLMLVAAGCGGGKKNVAATTEVATTTEATTTEATTTEADTDDDHEATTTEAASTTETATQEATTTAETTTTAGLSGIASAGNCKRALRSRSGIRGRVGRKRRRRRRQEAGGALQGVCRQGAEGDPCRLPAGRRLLQQHCAARGRLQARADAGPRDAGQAPESPDPVRHDEAHPGLTEHRRLGDQELPRLDTLRPVPVTGTGTGRSTEAGPVP